MDNKDYAELFLLTQQGEQAVLNANLHDWQHACTSTFCLLGQFILDINDRLAKLESATNQPVEIGSDE